MGREAIRKAHYKPRRKSVDFKTQQEKESFLQDSEFMALIPLVPKVMAEAMLGGELGLEQVPVVKRYDQLRRRLLRRAGATGDNLSAIRLGLATLREYAQCVLGAQPGSEDDALWPMSLGLAHDIANEEHTRAILSPPTHVL